MTAVHRKTEPVTLTGSADDNFPTLSDGEASGSQTDLESLDKHDLVYATDDKLNMKQ